MKAATPQVSKRSTGTAAFAAIRCVFSDLGEGAEGGSKPKRGTKS